MEPHMRNGDVLMVDRSIEPKVGKVVIAAINGEMTVKRLSVVDGQMTLTADNPNYLTLKVGDIESSPTSSINCEGHETSDCNCSECPKPSMIWGSLVVYRTLSLELVIHQLINL